MANNQTFSIEWFTAPFKDTMKDAARTTDRATMYALRATGRAMAKVAKARAPVYKGDDPRAEAESGQLRRSIKNSRTLNHIGTGDYSMFVGAFGSKKKGTSVHYGNQRLADVVFMSKAQQQTDRTGTAVRGVPLYRGKMETRYGYMAAAVAMGDASIRAILEDALAKGYAKYR